MNNDNLITPRDIRLKLASMLDQLGQLQSSESWETVTTEHPAIADAHQIAQTTLDDLWYLWRKVTASDAS